MMEKKEFVRFIFHFVKHLPPGQGKGGKPVLLTLDGHASRWCPLAMEYARENNVHIWCIASHTSVWCQPNDVGPNSKIKKAIKDSFTRWLAANKFSTIKR